MLCCVGVGVCLCVCALWLWLWLWLLLLLLLLWLLLLLLLGGGGGVVVVVVAGGGGGGGVVERRRGGGGKGGLGCAATKTKTPQHNVGNQTLDIPKALKTIERRQLNKGNVGCECGNEQCKDNFYIEHFFTPALSTLFS